MSSLTGFAPPRSCFGLLSRDDFRLRAQRFAENAGDFLPHTLLHRLAPHLPPADPGQAEARGFEDRLQASLKNDDFLALVVGVRKAAKARSDVFL